MTEQWQYSALQSKFFYLQVILFSKYYRIARYSGTFQAYIGTIKVLWYFLTLEILQITSILATLGAVSTFQAYDRTMKVPSTSLQ